MSDRDALKEIVSQLYHTPVPEIGASFSLRHPRFQGSAGRGLLAAAIRRRLGVYAPQAVSASTYGELEAAMFGTESNGSPAPTTELRPRINGSALSHTAATTNGTAGLSIGLDIEMVDNLPEVVDYWRSDFYRAHFTGPEIAYCMQQTAPRMHFAARWCAKEALAKCDARFMSVDPSQVQVSLEENGQPVLEMIDGERIERLPHSLSLTHTPVLAAAVVAVPSVSANGHRGPTPVPSTGPIRRTT